MQFFKKEKLFSNKNNFPLILVILLFYGLVSGPLIPEILIFIGIIHLFLKKEKVAQIFKDDYKFFYIFIIFCVYLILNSFLSEDYYLSFKNSLFFFRLLIPVFFIILAIEAKKNSFDIIAISLFILVFSLFADGLFSLIYGQNIFGLDVKKDRISSFFNDELIMGSFVVRVLPFYLACLILSNIKYKSVIFSISLIIFPTLVILSGERTAFALLIFFLISQIIFNQQIRIRYYKHLIFGLITGFFILISLQNTLMVKRLFLDTLNQAFDKDTKKITFFSNRHENHFLTGFLIFKNHLITGSGTNTFRIECKKKIYTKKIYSKILEQNTIKAKSDGKILVSDDFFEIIYENRKAQKINKKYIIKNFLFDDQIFNQQYNFKKDQTLWIVDFDYSDGCNTHPHNIVIQFISELGIVGTCFLIVFYFYIIKSILEFRKIKNNDLKCAGIIVLFGLIVNYFPLLPYGNFFNNWFAIINVLPLGLFLIIKKLNKFQGITNN
ncbi:oligosaccharide repeat unit polymerase [Pelagibacterales bacterium SAG-MED14]|nr:oligosaccharide repeat unit polymerase [Pelagibacterales bacterium SAG-MED14]